MESSYTGPRRGSDNSQSKLQAYQVLEIRARFAAGTDTQASLSREFGVGDGRISDIVNRKLWKHI
jgi:hypothetical protein